MTTIIGIDPGLTGALAVLRDGCVLYVFDMPIMPNGKGTAKIKNQVNPAALVQFLYGLDVPFLEMVVYMEAVTSMPRDAQTISFSLGDSVGTVRGVLAALGIPLTLVRSQVWKKHFGLLKLDKDFSRTKAQQLYPHVNLSLKKHHNRAEAILIATYGGQHESTYQTKR
jgi:crossover junction endodeoxyribonuclease RuvC